MSPLKQYYICWTKDTFLELCFTIIRKSRRHICSILIIECRSWSLLLLLNLLRPRLPWFVPSWQCHGIECPKLLVNSSTDTHCNKEEKLSSWSVNIVSSLMWYISIKKNHICLMVIFKYWIFALFVMHGWVYWVHMFLKRRRKNTLCNLLM